MDSYATRIAACSYHGRRCGLTHSCPVCRWSKGDNTWNGLLPQIRASLEQGARLVPVTLTVANIPLASLRVAFHTMRQKVRRVASNISGLTGIVANFESTPSERRDGFEHPHIHALLALDPSRNRGRDYTSALAIHEAWAEREPGGSANVLNLTRTNAIFVDPSDPSTWGSNIPAIAARHARYCSYMVKASPAQTKQQVEAELEHDFTERLLQLHGLHRLQASGSLKPKLAHTLRKTAA